MRTVVNRDTAALADIVKHAVWIRIGRPYLGRRRRMLHVRNCCCCLPRLKCKEQCKLRGYDIVPILMPNNGVRDGIRYTKNWGRLDVEEVKYPGCRKRSKRAKVL